MPVYCNRLTKEAIESTLQLKLDCRIFDTGGSFEIGDVVVDTFSIPHDAYDPVGFLLRTRTGNVGLLTDLGHATKLAIERVRAANVLILETNHDMKMLQDDPHRPWSLKQRILSRHGHLSNEAAADVAQEICSAELRQLYLGAFEPATAIRRNSPIALSANACRRSALITSPLLRLHKKLFVLLSNCNACRRRHSK